MYYNGLFWSPQSSIRLFQPYNCSGMNWPPLQSIRRALQCVYIYINNDMRMVYYVVLNWTNISKGRISTMTRCQVLPAIDTKQTDGGGDYGCGSSRPSEHRRRTRKHSWQDDIPDSALKLLQVSNHCRNTSAQQACLSRASGRQLLAPYP